MSLKRKLVFALRSLLALALAFVVVQVVNLAGMWLAQASGWPAGGDPRLAWDLLWVFLAGVAATWTAVKLAPGAPRGHAIAFFVLALVIDVVAVAQLGDGWPWWFSTGILLTLPLQVWLGAWLALRKRAASG
ncbi:hypothetical protein [Pseudoxanthomonas putridarboris]|uniref:Uncharacterized protein n=1 Tax=Pseudoxanthomonas putridarboris TaxID=752605 RepID=A0ABU9J3E7_9GAMM